MEKDCLKKTTRNSMMKVLYHIRGQKAIDDFERKHKGIFSIEDIYELKITQSEAASYCSKHIMKRVESQEITTECFC